MASILSRAGIEALRALIRDANSSTVLPYPGMTISGIDVDYTHSIVTVHWQGHPGFDGARRVYSQSYAFLFLEQVESVEDQIAAALRADFQRMRDEMIADLAARFVVPVQAQAAEAYFGPPINPFTGGPLEVPSYATQAAPCVFCAALREGSNTRMWVPATVDPLQPQVIILLDHDNRFVAVSREHSRDRGLPVPSTEDMKIALRDFLLGQTGFKSEFLDEHLVFTDVFPEYVKSQTYDALWPYLLHGTSSPLYLSETRDHPHVGSNVFQMMSHKELPRRTGDLLTVVAQRFVGYFYGEHVTAAQMASINGSHDPTVHRTGEPWVEPFEPGDDCVFCQRMTDESIIGRVDAFQYELDKESGILYHMMERLDRNQTTIEQRQEYRRQLVERGLWTGIDLTLLPPHLQRALCIQWNHVYRDWLTEDPRYSYREGDYYVMCMPRIGGRDTRPSIRRLPDEPDNFYAIAARMTEDEGRLYG